MHENADEFVDLRRLPSRLKSQANNRHLLHTEGMDKGDKEEEMVRKPRRKGRN